MSIMKLKSDVVKMSNEEMSRLYKVFNDEIDELEKINQIKKSLIEKRTILENEFVYRLTGIII